MANFSQPPFNMPPFPIPPPNPHHTQQHGVPSDPRHTSNSDNFVYNGTLPGLNLPSYMPSSQPQQYPYWPAPPAPPAPPPQSLHGVHFPPPFVSQPGYNMPLPPPPPGPNFFPHVAQSSLQVVSAPSPIGFHPSPSHQALLHPTFFANDRVAEIAEGEKEDGEVSEGDNGSRSPATAPRTVKEPPRSIPQRPQDGFRNANLAIDGPQGPQSTHHDESRIYPMIDSMHSQTGQMDEQTATSNSPDSASQKWDQAKQFIRLLQDHHIGYPALVSEGLDTQLLGDMYRSMNLPTQSEAIPTPKPIDNLALSAANGPLVASRITPTISNNPETQAPSVKTNISASVPTKSAPSPVDRKDYIARLQAAKMAKQSTIAMTTSPRKSPPGSSSASIPTMDQQLRSTAKSRQSATGIVAEPVLSTKDSKSAEERARKNELLKQRLAMLTAQQRQAASVPNPLQSSAGINTATITKTTAAAQPSPMSESLQNNNAKPSDINPVPKSDPIVSPVRAASFTNIPGLFMVNSSAEAPQPQQAQKQTSSVDDAVGNARRQRPVASDFEEATTPRTSAPVYTRPLGQSPHEHDGESMIIEVSDDESAGSEMDIEEDQPANYHLPLTNGHTAQPSLRNLPPLSDFPSRSGSARPFSSIVSTPPTTRTPGVPSDPEELFKKEKEIAAMKKKIEELSRKKMATTAKKTALAPSPSVAQSRPKQFISAPNSLASPSRLVQTSRSLESIATPSLSIATTASELKQKRRAEIESVLQALNASLETEQDRLRQLETEIAQIAANRQRYQQDKDNLIQELESLGIDTDGMPDSELQSTKHELLRHPEIISALQARESSTPLTDTVPLSGDASATAEKDTDISLQHTDVDNSSIMSDIDVPAASIPASETLAILAPTDLALENSAPGVMSQKDYSTNVLADHQTIQTNQAHVRPTTPAVNHVTPAKSAIVQDPTTPVDDGEDFYSPEPANLPPSGAQVDLNEPRPITAKSPSEEGEVEMSESASSSEDEEDYEPEEPNPTKLASLSRSGSPIATQWSPNDDEDMYEPPQMDSKAISAPSNATNVASSNVEQLEEEDDQFAMDISASPSSLSSSDENETDYLSSSGPAKSLNNAQDLPRAVSDDSTPHLLPYSSAATHASVPDLHSGVDTDAKSPRFVPYKSPLRMFKSYRYHPNYSEDVAGGFLSMTYSHQIDPMKPLCQYESMGTECNDPNCEDQHFQGMNISGERLLVQLGTANPGKTADEKQRWNDGLRLVLKELRQNNIKDPNGIAMEIAKYRRQFFNDDTRVVSL